MRSRRLKLPIMAMLPILVAACSTAREQPVAVVEAPPVAHVVPQFTGYGNLQVPPRLPDGGYATPNHGLSSAGAVWHLRAGLNVAALGCRGSDEAALIAGYNAILAAHRAEFAAAYRALGTEYGGLDAFDGAMTKLYNYYALPPAQPGLCAAAIAILNDAGSLPAGSLAGFAPGALARLDAPYAAVYAAQDNWLAMRIAVLSPAAPTQIAALPRLAVDPAVLTLP